MLRFLLEGFKCLLFLPFDILNYIACPCKVNNTELCEPVNQMCECKDGWEGNACDIDVDECLNITVCETFNNTGCQNREWGYDCLCLVGYELQNDTCIGNLNIIFQPLYIYL